MSDEANAHSTRRRAQGYLRWYPPAWRARYGEEFIAHLEQELNEQSFSLGRGFNIAVHGVTTRLRLQRALRAVISLGVGAFSVVVILALVQSSGATRVPLKAVNTVGAGSSAHPSQAFDVTFELTSRSRARVRFTKIVPVPLRGYSTPTVVGAAN